MRAVSPLRPLSERIALLGTHAGRVLRHEMNLVRWLPRWEDGWLCHLILVSIRSVVGRRSSDSHVTRASSGATKPPLECPAVESEIHGKSVNTATLHRLAFEQR